MTPVTLTINGRTVQALVEPRTHLADFLREHLHLTGTHLGCEQGVCGACTVSLDGIPQRSCIAYAVDCDGGDIRTIEGFDDDGLMAELREAFSAHHALQCGFCTPGMLITSRDIVMRLGDINDARIREELSGNLCRCTGYVGIVNAVRAVAVNKQPAVQTANPIVAQQLQPVAAAVVAAAPPIPVARVSAGDATLTESVMVNATPDAVWAALADVSRVASCVPGAEITEIEGNDFAGHMRVALGPIKASFAGRGVMTRDEATRQGTIAGQGRDNSSGSLAHGEARFAVREPGSGDGGAIIDVTLSWRLSGMLAQFNRPALVGAVVKQLAVAFAKNLEALIAGDNPQTARPLGLFALLWTIIRTRLFRP